MMLTKQKLNIFVLDSAYMVLMTLGDSGRYLTLVGAFSILREFKKYKVDYTKVGRATQDLDFDVYGKSITEVDYKLFQSAFSNYLGSNYNITYYPLKTRKGSTTYSFKVEYDGVVSNKLKIDFSLTKGQKYFDCQPLYLSLAKKIKLSNELVDRRPKDKLDVALILTYLYPNGVSKSELVTLLLNTNNVFKVNSQWFTEEGMALALRSVRTFKGVSRENIEFNIQSFKILLGGLYDNRVPNNAIFRKGEWYW